MNRRIWIAIFIGLLMTNIYTAQQYMDDVISGRQVACKYVKLAVERHLRDLKRVGQPDFPYYFDEAKAKRAIDFKQQLRHIEGEWANPRLHDTKFHMEPWQQFRTWVLFGWQKKGGLRRFTKSYTEIGRKNGKTFDVSADANYCFFADRPLEIGAQIYCVATMKEQAMLAWKTMRGQIEKHPILAKRSRIYKQNHVITRTDDSAALCTVWGKDAKTRDGFNPHVAIADEMHAWPDHSLLEVIESGMGARQQPLVDIITTAGFDINSSCYQEERTLAVQMLEGTVKPAPENFFAIIYTLDEKDDWTNRKVWIKSNPNLGVSLNWEYLEERVNLALQIPSKRNDILTKNFNVWTHAVSRAIPPEVWNLGDHKVDAEALAGAVCYAGLDLSTILDISTYCLCFEPDKKGKYPMLWRFFIPGDDIAERVRRDKVPFDIWIEQGLVIATPGNTIDYDLIEQEFLKDAMKYKIAEVGYDPFKAHEIFTHLTDAGFTMIPIQQRYSGMAAPTDEFLKAVFSGKIAHGGNPVMDWMISCLELKSDRQANVMPMKPERNKTGKRIDGAVAAIMAMDRAQRHGNGKSVYEERGAIVLGGSA